jgi:hypothetical protein
LRQLLVARPAHFDGPAAAAIVAPMALKPIKPFARAAIIAHKKIGLIFLVSGINRHDFLFEILMSNGRLTSSFKLGKATRFAADAA